MKLLAFPRVTDNFTRFWSKFWIFPGILQQKFFSENESCLYTSILHQLILCINVLSYLHLKLVLSVAFLERFKNISI